jgi:hypothetical protein
MRRLFVILLLLGSLAGALAAGPATGRVVKVLPLLLDSRNQDAVSPSLYDRDAYQAYLRLHTNEISAVRFDVLWKAANARDANLKLRVELRGVGAGGLPRATTLERAVNPGFFRRWTPLTLEGSDYKNFGEVVAWRVTLWSEDRLLDAQQSFLW